MTVTDPFSAPPQEVRRSKDGRPYIYDFDKGKEVCWPRATSFIDVLDDKSALAKWGERMALMGLRNDQSCRRELMALEPIPPLVESPTTEQVQEHEELLDEEKSLLNKLVSRAKQVAGSSVRADLGTHVHQLTEVIDSGGRVPATTPPALVRDLEAYTAALERFGLEPVEQEVFVANDHVKAAGTFDRIVDWTRPDGTTVRVISDLKTGRVDYAQGKLAMQLALYANAKRYDPSNPTERGDLDVSTEVGLIVHLPVGQAECKVYSVDLELGWRGVLLAEQVRQWRRDTARGVLNDLALEFHLEAMIRGGR